MMKRHLLLSIILLATSMCNAQFTLEDFPREASFTDNYILSSTIFDLPMEGSGLTWDFSSAETEELISREYIDATDDAFFENAFSYRQRDLSFQGLLIESSEYEALDEEGFSAIGRTITEVTYPVDGITGGTNDIVTFVGGNYLYEGENQYLDLPASYEDSWEFTFEEVIDFELSVASFGLDAAPGQQVRYKTITREVVGEGFFIIRDDQGQPSDPISGLLIRVNESRKDSAFLGGAPAPDALMEAFGLIQGDTFTTEFFVAYAYGLGTPLLSMNVDGNDAVNLAYRPQAAMLGDPSNSVKEFTAPSIIAYPNPVAKGQSIQLQTKSNELVASVQLFNMMGEKVHESAFNSGAIASGLNVAIPGHLPSGVYFASLLNDSGQQIGRSKFVVK